MDGPDRINELANIYTLLGDEDAALDQIEALLSIPCYFSIAMLRADPAWDSLRDHPRYAEILEKFQE